MRTLVRQGKGRYAAFSDYPANLAAQAIAILCDPGTPSLIHQPRDSMSGRTPEQGLIQTPGNTGVGCIAFSPRARGVLTDRHLQGIPEDSHAASGSKFRRESQLTDEKMAKVRKLNIIAQQCEQKLAQMALAWMVPVKRPSLIAQWRCSPIVSSATSGERQLTPPWCNGFMPGAGRPFSWPE